jgi:hypothetical protein
VQKEFTPPYVDDGLIEVVGFRDAWHGLVLLAPNGHGTRIAQVLTAYLWPWIEKPLENRPIFTKTEETGPDWFHRFLENQPVKIEFCKIK